MEELLACLFVEIKTVHVGKCERNWLVVEQLSDRVFVRHRMNAVVVDPVIEKLAGCITQESFRCICTLFDTCQDVVAGVVAEKSEAACQRGHVDEAVGQKDNGFRQKDAVIAVYRFKQVDTHSFSE